MLNKNHLFNQKHAIIFCSFLFFITAIFLHSRYERPAIKVSKQDSAYTLNSTFLKLISLGNKRVFSNVLWIQTLMESDHEKYKKHDYADWMYVRFLTIANLDPMFYENYLYGGMYLSVIKDDLEGAATIFDMGLQKYPTDYKILYYAGFNAFYELGDYERGYKLLKQIENHEKAPQLLKQVIAKLRFEVTGDYDMAIELLKENYKIAQDKFVKEKLEKDLYSLTAQRDLECLNNGQDNCNGVDLYGRPYIKRGSTWESQQTFKPYKIFRQPKD
jgi:tetratricopeptide (TPR) repeat protein